MEKRVSWAGVELPRVRIDGISFLNLRHVQGHSGILSSGIGGFPSSETGGLSNQEMCSDF